MTHAASVQRLDGADRAEVPALRLVTLRPAPRREPPCDDERDLDLALPGRYDQPLPFPATPVRAPFQINLPRSDTPDPIVWGRRMMIGVVEAAAGKRPMKQLAGMVAPAILAALGAEFAGAARRRRRHWLSVASVRGVRGCEPAPGVAELSATLHTPTRVHAVALRAEIRHGAWRCVKLQIG